jgi:chromosome segregation ATPase
MYEQQKDIVARLREEKRKLFKNYRKGRATPDKRGTQLDAARVKIRSQKQQIDDAHKLIDAYASGERNKKLTSSLKAVRKERDELKDTVSRQVEDLRRDHNSDRVSRGTVYKWHDYEDYEGQLNHGEREDKLASRIVHHQQRKNIVVGQMKVAEGQSKLYKNACDRLEVENKGLKKKLSAASDTASSATKMFVSIHSRLATVLTSSRPPSTRAPAGASNAKVPPLSERLELCGREFDPEGPTSCTDEACKGTKIHRADFNGLMQRPMVSK